MGSLSLKHAEGDITYVKTSVLETLFQRDGQTSLDTVDRQVLDHEIYTLNGELATALCDSPDDRMPTVLSATRLALGDLVPSTVWGASLANMLVDSVWQKIRLPLIEQNHHICQDCGQKEDRGQKSTTLHAHEIWDHYLPTTIGNETVVREAAGIQVLSRIAILCPSCHGMYHLGRAGIVGYLEEALYRLKAVNNWDDVMLQRYDTSIRERFRIHSQFDWILDLTLLQDLVPGIGLNSRWTATSDVPTSEVSETRPNAGKQSWDSRTAIIGIPWKPTGEKEFRPITVSPLS